MHWRTTATTTSSCLRRPDDEDVRYAHTSGHGRPSFDPDERIEVPKGGEDFYFAPTPDQVMSKLDASNPLDFIGQMKPENFLGEGND